MLRVCEGRGAARCKGSQAWDWKVCSRACWPGCVAVTVAATAGGCFLFCEHVGFSVQNKQQKRKLG